MKEFINAVDMRDMIISAAAAVSNNRQMLNELNVFPVPDGDTGINMSLTLNAAADAMKTAPTESISKLCEIAASSLLRGARGNSGVILSLLFRGFSKSCAGKETISACEFAIALGAGVDAAYRAVMKPAEGTILTVSRRAAEAAIGLCENSTDIVTMLDGIILEAQNALRDTVEQNPVLKKAGVVDAGGKGWVIVLMAMQDSLRGTPAVALDTAETQTVSVGDTSDEEIVFAYCTEYIVNLSREGKQMDAARLRAMLESMGDCVVVVDDDDIIKVHVHTNTPDRALCEALKYGELVRIKIENMREQHTQKIATDNAPAEKVAVPEKRYGFVGVAAGAGIAAVYKDLGVDELVQGGQTMNPSTEDILEAINKTPAKTVFVLPNNKNIIMAAEQTVELTDKQVIVIPTKTIPQGISAMLAFNPDGEEADNLDAMKEAASAVTTGSVTYAARDSNFDGHDIKQGEYLALCEGKLSGNGGDLDETLRTLCGDMHMSERSFVTLFHGDGVTPEQAEHSADICRECAPSAEIMVIDGGQPVYYYMLSAE